MSDSNSKSKKAAPDARSLAYTSDVSPALAEHTLQQIRQTASDLLNVRINIARAAATAEAEALFPPAAFPAILGRAEHHAEEQRLAQVRLERRMSWLRSQNPDVSDEDIEQQQRQQVAGWRDGVEAQHAILVANLEGMKFDAGADMSDQEKEELDQAIAAVNVDLAHLVVSHRVAAELLRL